jgi:hypothetical protein
MSDDLGSKKVKSESRDATAFGWFRCVGVFPAVLLLVLGTVIGNAQERHRRSTTDHVKKQSGREVRLSQRILTADDFRNGRVNRGTGQEEVTWMILIHPKLSPYVFHLVPNPKSESTLRRRSLGQRSSIGHIEISEDPSSPPQQVINVKTWSEASWLINSFMAEDVNFDGYTDFLVADDFGTKWESHKVWLFEKRSGKFITNSLTKELGALRTNKLDFDSKSQTVHAHYLNLDVGRVGEVYKIAGGHLVLIQVDERQRDKARGWVVVTKEVRKGKMVVTKITKE